MMSVMAMRIKRLNTIFKFTRNESGGALAELAILVPFLLVMLAGIAEFGRYFETYTTLAKSTRAAARYLSNSPFDAPHIAAAKSMAVCGKTACASGEAYFSGLTTAAIDVTSTETEGSTAVPETITVAVTGFTYTPIFDIGALLHTDFSLALPVRPSTTMFYMLREPSGAGD